ncbi:DUF1996 domain-containing protein [Micromonospora maritima]|nr:DUF1996 domain-containing protein [Micromonospora maritima]
MKPPGVGRGVQFPECWDGVRLDSPDHRSHLAYADRGDCPRHPVAVPGITLSVNVEYGRDIQRSGPDQPFRRRSPLRPRGLHHHLRQEATLGRLVAGCPNAANSGDRNAGSPAGWPLVAYGRSTGRPRPGR